MEPTQKKRQQQQNAPPYTSLPFDVQMEILSYLPVTTLLRLRTVSRSFHSLISSPEFALLHASRSHLHPQFSLSHSHSASLLRILPLHHSLPVPVLLPSPHAVPPLLSPSLGVVLSLDRSGAALALNPLTGASLRLPPKPRNSHLIGFGLIPSSPSPSFKAVVVSHRFVSVCSLRPDAVWRRIPVEFPRLFWSADRALGLYHDGALYWSGYARARPSGRHLILSFDLARETFRTSLGPQLDSDEEHGRCFLATMGPDLGFVIKALGGKGVQVWKLVDAEDAVWKREEDGVVGVLGEVGMGYSDPDPGCRDIVYYDCQSRRFEYMPFAVVENNRSDNVRVLPSLPELFVRDPARASHCCHCGVPSRLISACIPSCMYYCMFDQERRARKKFLNEPLWRMHICLPGKE